MRRSYQLGLFALLVTAAGVLSQQTFVRAELKKLMAKDKPPEDKCALFAESFRLTNQIIPLGNRLIAHYRQAQTWDGVDASHPAAVSLRDKITGEEREFLAKVDESRKNAALLPSGEYVTKNCSAPAEPLPRLTSEYTAVINEVVTQNVRYHSLGY